MKKALLASAACAALATVAQAAPVATVVNLGVPDDGSSGPLVGYHAYKVSISTGDSSVLQGFDFSNEGVAGKDFEFATPIMHQQWFQNKKVIFTSEVGDNINAATSYDSFLIIPGNDPARISVGSAQIEDNNRTTSPFAGSNPAPNTGVGDVFGGGTFLRMAYGVVGAFQTSSNDVAYLVLSDAGVAQLPGGLLATPAIATSAGTFPVEIRIPEPATAGLLGLGLLAGLARRRRA